MNSIVSYEDHMGTPMPKKSKNKMNVGGDPDAGLDEEEEEESKRKKNEAITNEEHVLID
jgi:hypothetical protein